MTRVLVMQHGEKERSPGDPGLTAAGLEQARRTAAWLQAECRPTGIWSSPLRRAIETASCIADAFGMPVATDVRLRERMNWDSAEQSMDDFVAAWRRTSVDRSYLPRSGDSSHDAAERFIAALGDIADRCGDESEAIVVAHGGVTVDALRTLLGERRLRAGGSELVEDGVPCCAVTTFVRTSFEWTARLPSTAHLASSSSPSETRGNGATA